MRYSLIISLLIFSLPLFSQDKRCGSDHYHEQKEASNPGLIKKKEEFNKLIAERIEAKKVAKIAGISAEEIIYRIPVVVHVIHNNSSNVIGGSTSNKNISEAQIHSQIDVLNQDFRKITGTPGENNEAVAADTRIEFCLATRDPNGNFTSGITRTYNSKTSFYQGADDEYLKSLAYWPSDQYMNLWVCDLADNVIGYAQFPYVAYGSGVNGLSDVNTEAKTDGVVVDYTAFGTSGTAKAPYNQGRTTTHEVGHWLGLFHLWGEGSGGCGTDYVDDTPPDADPNYSADCIDYSMCSGVETKDQAHNYMDYSPDGCMNLYTIGQKNRMRAVIELNTRRRLLLSSPGCCGGGVAAPLPMYEDFETNDYLKDGWIVVNKGGNKWAREPYGAYDASAWSIAIAPDGTFSGDTTTSTDYDLLESPFLDFSAISKPFMTFDLACGKSGNTDSLVVSYNVACNDWIYLASYTGNDLITSSDGGKNFHPGKDDWKNVVIDLSPLGGKKLARVRFERYSNKGSTVFLDNINLIESTDKLSVLAYPVPAHDQVSFKVTFKDIKDIHIMVYNSIGQLISEGVKAETRSFIHQYDIRTLAEGVYFFKVVEGNNFSVIRFVVTKK